jgi:hypothetical protein
MSADAGAGIPRTAEPVLTGTWAGLPVYRTGAAPEHLRTPNQLREERLNVAAGQQQRGWLYVMLHHQRVPLYDPREAEPMRPLPAGADGLRTWTETPADRLCHLPGASSPSSNTSRRPPRSGFGE